MYSMWISMLIWWTHWEVMWRLAEYQTARETDCIVWEGEQRHSWDLWPVGLWLADKDSPVSSPHTVNQQPTPSDTTMKYKLSSWNQSLTQGGGRYVLSCVLSDISCGRSHYLLICGDFFYLSTQLIIPALSLIPNNPTGSHWLRAILYFKLFPH